MKKTALLLALLLTFCFSSERQTTKGKNVKNDSNLEKRIAQIEDRIAIKELVDTFSNLADVKDVPKQVLLFTENAVVAALDAAAKIPKCFIIYPFTLAPRPSCHWGWSDLSQATDGIFL